VFPGLGLATSVAGVAETTDHMLFAAALACVDTITPEEVAEGRTLPELSRIRQVRDGFPTQGEVLPPWKDSRKPGLPNPIDASFAHA
jgi:malic enzyme